MEINCAMLFAAGLGKRMLPLTANLPKPMIKVGGVTLIERIIWQLVNAGIQRLVINSHYLADMLESYLSSLKVLQRLEWVISHETELLETGGGVAKVIDFFENKPFFTINSDMMWLDKTISPLQLLENNFDADKMQGLLLLKSCADTIGYTGLGDFSLGPDMMLEKKRDAKMYPYVFPGIQLLQPTLFNTSCGEKFSLNKFYQPDEDGYIPGFYGVEYDGYCLHVGDPQGLQLAEEFMLQNQCKL